MVVHKWFNSKFAVLGVFKGAVMLCHYSKLSSSEKVQVSADQIRSVRLIDQCEVKIAGYWPIFLFSFFCVLWTAANSSSIRTRVISTYLDLLAGKYNAYRILEATE